MSTRHEGRMRAVQFLFQRDFNNTELDEAIEQFWRGSKASAKARAYVESLIRGVEANRAEIDAQLQKFAANWDVKRMGAVDRNVMRLSIYEMMRCPDVPPVVSINEAVDLAKELSSEESGRFVNGVLDRARKELERAGRAPAPARE